MTRSEYDARSFIEDLVLTPPVPVLGTRELSPKLELALRQYRMSVLDLFGPIESQQELVWSKMRAQQYESRGARASGTRLAVAAAKRLQDGIEHGHEYGIKDLVRPAFPRRRSETRSADARTHSVATPTGSSTSSCVSHSPLPSVALRRQSELTVTQPPHSVGRVPPSLSARPPPQTASRPPFRPARRPALTRPSCHAQTRRPPRTTGSSKPRTASPSSVRSWSSPRARRARSRRTRSQPPGKASWRAPRATSSCRSGPRWSRPGTAARRSRAWPERGPSSRTRRSSRACTAATRRRRPCRLCAPLLTFPLERPGAALTDCRRAGRRKARDAGARRAPHFLLLAPAAANG